MDDILQMGDLAEAAAYADGGPAISRKTVGRLLDYISSLSTANRRLVQSNAEISTLLLERESDDT